MGRHEGVARPLGTISRSDGQAHRLQPLLAPGSIAFLGASTRPDTPGHTMVRAAALDGYQGRLYAINPKYDDVEGVPCFPDLDSLPETVEHVVLGLGNEHLEAGLLRAIRHGAKAATIFASCDPTGATDDPLAGRLAAIAREAGISICGGNCMGFLNPSIGLRVSGFAAKMPIHAGGAAFITQSGSAFSALAYNDQRLRYAICVSSGRELTTSVADYVDWSLDQPATRVVGLFLETARQPDAFVEALRKADRLGVPVVVLKVGRTALSAGFAASHSGAIAGDDAAYEALFSKWGVISVDTLDQLSATMLLFSTCKAAPAGGLASIHDSGGEREMVVDLASAAGVPFAAISDETMERLRPHLDSGLQPANPLDVWGSGRNFETHVEAALDALLADPATAAGALFQDARDGSYVAEGFARAVIRSSHKVDKPVVIVSNYASVNHRALALATTEAGVPVIDGTQEGLNAIANLFAFRDRARAAPSPRFAVAEGVRQRWRDRLGRATPLSEAEGLTLLSDYGIRVPRSVAVTSLDQAIRGARAIGFPLALKTAQPGIQHKSDSRGVVLDLADETALATAYEDMASRLGPRCLLMEMAPRGVEIALGLVHDRQFGPYLVVASGGIWIELLKDRCVGMPPLNLDEAAAMIRKLRVDPLLDGRRGMAACDRKALYETLCRFSWLAVDLGDLVGEMDVNPLIVSPGGCFAVDALVAPLQPTSHSSSEGDANGL